MSSFEDKSFDDALRDKLSQHSTSLPRDLWSEISQKVESDGARDQSRWKKWGWLGVVFLLISTGVALEFNRSISPIELMFPSTERAQLESTDLEAQVEFNSLIEKNVIEQAELVESEDEIELITTRILTDNSSQSKTSLLVKDNSIRSVTSVLADNGNPFQSQPVINNEKEITPILEEEKIEDSSQKDPPIINTGNRALVTENDDEVFEKGNEIVILEAHSAKEGFDVSERLNDTPVLVKNPITTESSLDESSALEMSVEQEANPVLTPSMQDDLVRKKWSMDLLIGPSMNYRTFNSSANPELQSHKNSHDRILISTSYAVMINREISNRIGLSTGLFWLNTGEKYEYTVNAATHSFTNHYDYLSIPLEVDYLIWTKGGLDLNAGAGVQYNFLKEGSSSWVDLSTLQPVTHSNKGPESPFSEEAWALNVEIGVRYAFNDHLDIILQERGTFFQESLYKEDTGIDQRPYSFNTMLGIGIKF